MRIRVKITTKESDGQIAHLERKITKNLFSKSTGTRVCKTL